MTGFWKLIFWEFPRASWQYDLVVALILGFIFVTPRDFFKDQPKPSSVVLTQGEHGAIAYWIEPDLLSALPESQWKERAAALIRSKTNKTPRSVRVEPIFDAEKDIRGYLAYTNP